MRGALFGTETEFACAGDFPPAHAAIIVKNQVFSTGEFGIIDPAPREWGETPGNGGFLFNGGRLYIDSGHLEYATPECRTLRELVAHEAAGERIVIQALDQLDSRSKIFFIKNNADYFGNTYGYHENYCLAENPRRPEVTGTLMPFLVTRQVFAGAGLLYRYGPGSDYEYQIAQRSAFVEVDQSSRVRFGGRPIVNLRDEPLGDRRRLHVIVGDANRSEFATALKIGTTALVAQLADGGWSPGLELVNPVETIRSIAKQIGGPWPVLTLSHGLAPAVAVQRMYLAEAERRFAGRDEDTDWTLSNWARVLTGLEEDPARLRGQVDWVSKLEVLESFADGSPLGWSDDDLCKVELAYHHVDPAVSLYSTLREREQMEIFVPAGAVLQAVRTPPEGTRALGRSKVVRRLSELGAESLIHWKNLRQGLGELTLWDENLYLVYQYIEDWRDLLSSGAWDIVPYLIDWSAIAVRGQVLELSDPFERYESEAGEFARKLPDLLSVE